MAKTRRQLTLFAPYHKEIEEIRKLFNPIQYDLIAAHITLCREDEVIDIDRIIANINSICLKEPFKIELDNPIGFENGKGVLLPAKNNNHFDQLRKIVLNGVIDLPRLQQAHVTLMHPRNSICTEAIFEQIKNHKLPTSLSFDAISLIEQVDDEPWKILEQYSIVS